MNKKETLKQQILQLSREYYNEPQKNSNPSWFGFLISVKQDAGFTRNELSEYLESKKI